MTGKIVQYSKIDPYRRCKTSVNGSHYYLPFNNLNVSATQHPLADDIHHHNIGFVRTGPCSKGANSIDIERCRKGFMLCFLAVAAHTVENAFDDIEIHDDHFDAAAEKSVARGR